MSDWIERFKNHQIWNQLQNLGPAIDDALKREGNDPPSTEGLARLKSVLTFTGKRLGGADPYLINFAHLDSLSSQFQTITQETQHFTANGNVGHITNANTNADAALNTLAQINVLLTTDDFTAAKEASDTYRKGLDNILSELRGTAAQLQNELDALKNRISEATTDINNEKARLNTVSTDFQTKFVTDHESRSKEFTAAQKAQQDQFTALITEFKEKLIAQNTDFTKQGSDIALAHKSELDELKDNFVDEATKLCNEITQRKEEVEELVGVIGNLGVTSGYLKTANGAKITTWVWQGITVSAIVGLIVFAIVAFLPAIGNGFSWGPFAGRVFVSLTFGVLAAYAASQADKYQKIERHSRKLALELEAIGPFIAPLPTAKQEEFRMTIGDRSFGHGESAMGIGDSRSPATLADLLLQSKESKELRAFITEIVKAVK